MNKFSVVNWNEVIRKAIKSKIREEELRRVNHLIKMDARITDSIRAKHAEEGWSSAEEIGKWRDARKY